MITASGIARIRACAASAVLARADTISVWANAGNEDHERLARWTTTRADAEIAEIVDSALLERLSDLVPVGARAEVKLAYDVATRIGRIIGEGGGRSYGTPAPMEIVGSTDVLASDARVIVADWKTGYSDVEPAATNDQLWFYALAACRALGKSEAVIRIIYTKTGRVDEHVIDAYSLGLYADELHDLVLRDAAARRAKSDGHALDTREGSWCKHCPSKAYCPSKNALLAQVASNGLAVIGDVAMTPERAAQAHEQIKALEQLVEDAKKRRDTWVDDNGPIPLGNGKSYGRFAKKANESLDARIAVQAIREVVGERARDFEAEAAELKVTKAGIKRAAQKLVAIGASKTEKAVIEHVRELGGVKGGGTYYPIGEVASDKVLGKAPELGEADAAALNRALAEAG